MLEVIQKEAGLLQSYGTEGRWEKNVAQLGCGENCYLWSIFGYVRQLKHFGGYNQKERGPRNSSYRFNRHLSTEG